MTHAGGRPTIIPRIRKQFIKHIRAGNFIDTVCTALGISERVYYKWQSSAETIQSYLNINNIIPEEVDINKLPDDIRSKWVYWQFIQSVKRAEAEYEIEAVSNIRNAPRLDKNWVAEMTVLSRRVRRHWQETQGIDQETLKLGLSVFDRLLKALERPATPSVEAPGPALMLTSPEANNQHND